MRWLDQLLSQWMDHLLSQWVYHLLSQWMDHLPIELLYHLLIQWLYHLLSKWLDQLLIQCFVGSPRCRSNGSHNYNDTLMDLRRTSVIVALREVETKDVSIQHRIVITAISDSFLSRASSS